MYKISSARNLQQGTYILYKGTSQRKYPTTVLVFSELVEAIRRVNFTTLICAVYTYNSKRKLFICDLLVSYDVTNRILSLLPEFLTKLIKLK